MNFLCRLLVTILIIPLKGYFETKKDFKSLMREIDICANQYGKFFNDVRFKIYAIEQAVKINNIWTKVYVSKKFSKRQRYEMREHILELAKKYKWLVGWLHDIFV